MFAQKGVFYVHVEVISFIHSDLIRGSMYMELCVVVHMLVVDGGCGVVDVTIYSLCEPF